MLVSEALVIIDHYEYDTRDTWRGAQQGKMRGSTRYSDEQLIAIALNKINIMGTAWHQSVMDYEERARLQGKLNSYDVEWVNSPYYKHNPQKQLPEDYEERKQHLQNRIAILDARLEKRTQSIGRVSRSKATTQRKYA
ncbi:hypothetical protein [Bacillus thuringiensis]|uniref:hypothetical protein n=1 Tax=Bacillus thuringiensis TaxID=1428 RepID=UPI0021D64CB2|nr:hypothetical protein [Bacillus thuringiensis]MCU7667073.1 hypothetical protein [Bacillus thuringiensis]